jgi:hypothetical protein
MVWIVRSEWTSELRIRSKQISYMQVARDRHFGESKPISEGPGNEARQSLVNRSRSTNMEWFRARQTKDIPNFDVRRGIHSPLHASVGMGVYLRCCTFQHLFSCFNNNLSTWSALNSKVNLPGDWGCIPEPAQPPDIRSKPEVVACKATTIVNIHPRYLLEHIKTNTLSASGGDFSVGAHHNYFGYQVHPIQLSGDTTVQKRLSAT